MTFNEKADELKAALQQLERALRCAERITQLKDEPEEGITFQTRMDAIADVLKVGVARSEGKDATVAPATMKVMYRLLADAETRILWDKLGLTHWRPA